MERVDSPWWIVAIKNYPPLPYLMYKNARVSMAQWDSLVLDVLNMYVAVNNNAKLMHIPECCMWAVIHCHQHVSIHCLLCMPLVFSYLYHNHWFMHSCFWALYVNLASILCSILCAPDISVLQLLPVAAIFVCVWLLLTCGCNGTALSCSWQMTCMYRVVFSV